MVKKLLIFVLTFFFEILFKIVGEPDGSPHVAKILALYKKGFGGLFAKIRFWDSPLVAVEKKLPKTGLILDLGCGEGIFTNYMALASPRRKIIGIELNSERIREGNKGLKNVSFQKGDVTKLEFPKVDVVTLFHLLHHLGSFDEQERILSQSSNALRPGGKIVIVEIDKRPFLKYLLTWITDAIIVPILFEGKNFTTDFYYREKEEWLRLFKGLGLKTKTYILNRKMPYSHVVFVCEKQSLK